MSLDTIQLGIFDHSGVLSDDRLPVYEADMFLLERYEQRRILFEDWLLESKASAYDFVVSRGIDVSKEEINKEYERIYAEIVGRKHNPLRPTMYADVPEVLRTFKEERELKLAIVSSHPTSHLVRELQEYNILSFFDEVSGDPSPKKERLESICQQFQVPPQDAFFVEDTVYGLRSGYQAQVNCFGVTTGYHSRKQLEAEGTAIAVIDSLSELLDFV